MSDPAAYLANILRNDEPIPMPSATTDATLAAIRALCQDEHAMSYGITVGIIASKAGLSYAQTQRDLIWLKSRGQVVEMEKVKSDGHQLRYRVTP